MKENKTNRGKSLLIMVLLLMTALVFIPNVGADPTFTFYQLQPQTQTVQVGDQITIHVYVTPRDNGKIDTVSIGDSSHGYTGITFPADKLQYVDGSDVKGNLFRGKFNSSSEVYISPAYDNDLGIITDWLDGGNIWNRTINPGWFGNITFDTIAPGMAYLNITYTMTVYNGTQLPDQVTYNSTLTLAIGNVPKITAINPTNGATGVDLRPAVSVTESDQDGDTMNTYINISNGDSGPISESWTGMGNGTRTISSGNRAQIATFGKQYNWTVQVYDINGNYNSTSATFTLRGQYWPNAPTSFAAIPIDIHTIGLGSWVKGTGGADKTYIMAKIGSTPTNRTDGTNIYNGTGIAYTHTGLSPSQHWYYAAWSYNNTDGTWSNSSATANATTPANSPLSFTGENPTNGSTGVSFSLSQLYVMITDPDHYSFNWSIRCSNGNSNSGTGASDGIKTLSLSSLAMNTTYTWWVNGTDDMGAFNETWYTFTTSTNSPAVIGTPIPGNGTTGNQQALSWNVNITDPELDTISWTLQCSNGQYTSGGGAGGNKALSIGGLAYSTTYTVWANATDSGSGLTVRQWFTFRTLDNGPAVIGTPTPGNASIDNPLSLTWNVSITDPELESITWTIQCSNGQQTSGGAGGGNKAIAIGGLAYLTTYTVWVNATDTGNGTTIRKIFTFTTVGFYAPSSFTATTVDRFSISLTWTKDTHATTTYVRGKLGSTPTGMSDGLLICNATGTYWTHAALNPGEHWYYAAWSYDATNAVWSSTNATANTTTTPNTPSDTTVPQANGTTGASTYYDDQYINISDANGDHMNLTVIWSYGGGIDHTIANGNGLSNSTINIIQPEIVPDGKTVYINVSIWDQFNWTNRSYSYQVGTALSVGFDFAYLYVDNTNNSGYNFLAQIKPWWLSSSIASYLDSMDVTWDNNSNPTWEYITYWNASNGLYGQSYYNGTGSLNHNYSSGEVILISVLQNGSSATYSSGWAPSGSWETIHIYQGTNWLGRTVSDSTNAAHLGENLTADGVHWTYLKYWDKDTQSWASAWINPGSGNNFAITAGEAILVATNATGSFSMFGW